MGESSASQITTTKKYMCINVYKNLLKTGERTYNKSHLFLNGNMKMKEVS